MGFLLYFSLSVLTQKRGAFRECPVCTVHDMVGLSPFSVSTDNAQKFVLVVLLDAYCRVQDVCYKETQ